MSANPPPVPDGLIRNTPWRARQTLPPQAFAHTGATGYWVVCNAHGKTLVTVELQGGTKEAKAIALLLAEAPALLSVLVKLMKVFPNDCRLDHHGLCQEHNCGTDEDGNPACEVKEANEIIQRMKEVGVL